MGIVEEPCRGNGISKLRRQDERAHAQLARLVSLSGFVLALLSFPACVGMHSLTTRTAPAPQVPWTPPPGSEKPVITSPPAQIPPELLQSKQNWTLANLIDIGLSNNMQTRAAWTAARSAAAALGSARSAYFPRVTADLTGGRTKGSVAGGLFTFNYSSLNPAAGLSLLLFDFGGRGAGYEEARQALAAANWTHNAVIQNVILQIEESYYQYLTAKALLKAQEASLKEAETNLDAANQRHQAGVATIADVLQAKTAASSTQLAVVSTQGLIQTIVGGLANSIGLPANTIFEVADQMPESLPLERVSGEVDHFIQEAQAMRPDLAAARSRALRAEAHIRTVRSSGLPTLVANGNIGRTYYSNRPKPSNTFGASIVLDFPIFTGFSNNYQILQAKVDAETAKAEMQQLVQDVTLQVWTSYYNVNTAAQRIKTSQDLFDSAQQSYEVALATYKEGVGDILGLLSAQSSLESGRVQLIQAKTDWLLALVQFAHDTGTLGLSEEIPSAVPSAPAKKGDN